MKFSREWLAQYVELPESPVELAARLTAAGFAVEGVEESAGDVVLDVEVTTNRPDAMCHFGLARELSVLLGQPLSAPPAEPPVGAERSGEVVRVRLEDDDCPRYVARVVRGVEVGPSPPWLARRLEALGHRPHNNVVDVTNYVLWETGQPIHAFDLATLPGGEIVVRAARPGEELVTLDGLERRLDAGVLVIADAERAVALAGIMGGRDTEVSSSTRDILIESAHFRPARVRRGSAKLGLHTDASHRFERGTDPEGCAFAADRVALLLAEVAGGTASIGAVDARRGDLPTLFGYLEPAALGRFAGVDIAPAEIERVLSGLGFAPQRLEDGTFRATVPPWRHYDFAAGRGQEDGAVRVWEADLYEEVMRVVGFDAVPSALPALGEPDEGASDEHRLREGVRAHLAACGLAEAINYAFHDAASWERFEGLAGGDAPLRLANPVSEALAVLRRSLLPGLVECARFNARRGAGSVGLFEIGRVFPSGGGEEVEGVGVVIGGAPDEPWQRPSEPDLFDLKGYLESLAGGFGLRLTAEPAEIAGLVPGTSFRLRPAGDPEAAPVGYAGRLEDEDFPFAVYAGELATASLRTRGSAERSLDLPSRHPGVAVDLTLTHSLDVGWSRIAAAIAARGVEHLVDFGLKDRYRGEGVPEGAVNTTVYFLYNASDRSLTREEVNASLEGLREELEATFGWQR